MIKQRLARGRIQYACDGQRVVQVFIGRFADDHADHPAILVQQRAATVAGRGGSGEADPLPAAILFLGGLGGEQAIADHDAIAQRIAHGVNRIIDLRRA